MKNSLLIHYFLVNLSFSRGISVSLENVPCKAFYSRKKWGLEQLLDNVGFILDLNHYYRKLAFHMLLKP